MKNRILNLAILSLLLLLIASSYVYTYYSTPRIAVVRSLDVIYRYNGMIDARNKFKDQTDEWQSNIDTLRRRYTVALENYQNNIASYSSQKKKDEENKLAMLEDNLSKYTSVVQDKAREKETKATEAVLKQINSFIMQYSEAQGYDIVLGADGSGVLLYGTESWDITEEIIRELNQNYKIIIPIDSISN